jgi:hypothetical protein
MSKEGVKKTLEIRKTRKQVKLEDRDGTVGKNCSKCGEWKPLDVYQKDKSKSTGRTSHCKECLRVKNPKKKGKSVELSFRESVSGKVCSRCNEWKPLGMFGETKQGDVGYVAHCRPCDAKRVQKYRGENNDKVKERDKLRYRLNTDKMLERNRKYYEKNREEILIKVSTYQRENRQIMNAIGQRRLARKKRLPSTLTAKQYEKTLGYFENACALTGRNDNIEREHAIPLSIGHGGTTFENCYPMANGLNQSKGNKNIFEWFEANRQRFELSQERFDKLIAYLASANAMIVEEYRDYVYWCHANPRSIDEIKNEKEEAI